MAAEDLPAVLVAAGLDTAPPKPETLDDVIARAEAHLVGYQGKRLARRYRALVERVREAEARQFSGGTVLTEAVARNYRKLLAYKDEYEVARLYSSAAFRKQLAEQFETPEKIEFYLAPPLLAARDKETGHLVKRKYGQWLQRAFRMLAPLKVLRGTALDPFGRSEERVAERALIGQYEADIAAVLAGLDAPGLARAVKIASLPDMIRGFGHVKEASMRRAAAERAKLV
jgi:indolepyruvate ferredoxin oxidoreductase